MRLTLALLVGAFGAALGPTLARAASVLYMMWPSAVDLWGRDGRGPGHARTAGCTVACASLFTLAALHWGGTARLGPHLLLFAVLVVVTVIDLEHSLIPNRVVFPALGLSVVATALVSVVD